MLLLLLACAEAPPPAASPDPAPPVATKPAAPALDPLPAPSPPTRAVRHPAPLTAPADLAPTRRWLEAVVDQRAVDPGNAWALAHAIAARGPDLALPDGKLVIDHLFETWAEPFEVAGQTLLRFPSQVGEVRVEPHADLLLKTMVESGASPERLVRVHGEPTPIARLWQGSLRRSHFVPERNHSRYKSPDDIAWSLYGLSGWAPPGLRWQAEDGTPMALDTLTDFAAAVLKKETAFLAEARARGERFERRGQGIFRYTCGGAHLLGGLAQAVARGFGSPGARRILQEQAELQAWRFPIEAAGTTAAAKALPEHRERLAVQRLKFAGHYLESSSQLLIQGQAEVGTALHQSQAAAIAELQAAVAELRELRTFERMDELRRDNEQLYLDVVGDSSHALHGLKLVLGEDELRW